MVSGQLVTKVFDLRLVPWVGYIASILLANWMIQNVGDCVPNGPCLIPVGFGYTAPSGVLMIGLALVLRDAIHESHGRWWVIGAIFVGAVLSSAISPALALASGVAFAVSEVGDMLVYEPIRRYSRPLGVAISGIVGGAIDSALFLMLAFGSLAYFEGNSWVRRRWQSGWIVIAGVSVGTAMIYLSGKWVDEFRVNGDIGMLCQPNYPVPPQEGISWAADTGIFGTMPFSLDRYLEKLGTRQTERSRCLFATAPDVVADWEKTLKTSMPVMPAIRDLGYRAALVLQDGATSATVPLE